MGRNSRLVRKANGKTRPCNSRHRRLRRRAACTRGRKG